MQDGTTKCNIKLLTILSLTATLATLALLAAVPLCGLQGFTSQPAASQSSSGYFRIKFEREPRVVYGVKLLIVVLAACFLIGENVVVVRSYIKQKELQQNSPNINVSFTRGEINYCYILTSLALMLLVPASAFYLSLNFEQTIALSWLLATLGLLALLITLIVWIIFTRLAVSSPNEQQPKAESAVDQCEKMQEIFNMKVPPFGQLQEKQNDLKTAFDMQGAAQIFTSIKTYKQSQQHRNEMSYPNYAIPLFPYPGQPGDNSHAQSKAKSAAKKERENAVKNTLLAEIEKRKKKFRDLNPIKEHIIEERSDEESQDIDDKDCPRLTNLPKSYRQYIKESKRPPRKILLKTVPETPPIPFEEKIDNRLDNERIQKAKANFTKESATSKEGELVYTTTLKANQRERKMLFQELGEKTGENGIEEIKQKEDDSPRMKQKKKDPSKEDSLMQMLKRKYKEDAQ